MALTAVRKIKEGDATVETPVDLWNFAAVISRRCQEPNYQSALRAVLDGNSSVANSTESILFSSGDSTLVVTLTFEEIVYVNEYLRAAHDLALYEVFNWGQAAGPAGMLDYMARYTKLVADRVRDASQNRFLSAAIKAKFATKLLESIKDRNDIPEPVKAEITAMVSALLISGPANS